MSLCDSLILTRHNGGSGPGEESTLKQCRRAVSAAAFEVDVARAVRRLCLPVLIQWHVYETTMSAAARAEARRKAILSRGGDRLAKLTSSARGDDASAYMHDGMSICRRKWSVRHLDLLQIPRWHHYRTDLLWRGLLESRRIYPRPQ